MAHIPYNLILFLLLLLGVPLLPLVLFSGKRFREGFLQRLGVYSPEIEEIFQGERPLWIHAVSVGEVLSARSLVEEMRERFPRQKILLTTFTVTGREIGVNAVRGADAVVLFPLDFPWIVRRALRVFHPGLVVLLETEIWPNFLRIAHRKGIPTVMVSGRVTPRAFRRYRRFRYLFSDSIGRITAAGMQTEEDAERLIRLGADPLRVSVTGSLKHAGEKNPPRTADAESIGMPAEVRREHRILVGGSTHRGEEEILLDAYQELKLLFPSLLLVLAPRHPHRFSEVERLLEERGISYGKRSQMNGQPERWPQVIVVDTLGELPLFYSLADIAFVGGSLVDVGGHNILEPARYRKPVLFGPHMTSFAESAEALKQSGGGVEIASKEDLVREVSLLLSDPKRAEETGARAYQAVAGHRGVLEGTLNLVTCYLDQ